MPIAPRSSALTRALFLAASTLAVQAQALDLQGIDPGVAACTDFYAHVNGRWEANTPLPADRARIGSFIDLREANDRVLQQGLAELLAKPELQATPGLKLVAAYYASGMDQAAIEAQGLKALQPLLDRIRDVKSPADLPALLAALSRLQIAAPLGAYVDRDVQDTRRYVLSLGQGGLGLPDREDYFKTDEVSRRVQAAYRVYARSLLELAGAKPSDADIDALLAFETELARASKTRVQQRDPKSNYNPMDLAALSAQAKGLDWQAYLSTLTGRAQLPARFIVSAPGFAQRVAELGASTPARTWQLYLQMRLLDASASKLPKAYADAYFAYYGATVAGLKAQEPLVERVILSIGGRTGGAPVAQGLGELFVAKAFPAEAQKRSMQLVEDIKTAMRASIERAPWMNPATKQRALAKLEAMALKVGAPSTWPRYEGLTLKADDYAGNMLRANAWQFEQRMADLDRPVDRTRWNTSPHIVNAFAAGGNEIVFPAGILQPPFFDARADDAVNYGGIGMVIGHEITHHFDDRGRQYDSLGNLADWWTPEDATAYKQRADRVAELYSSYEPVPGHHINGQLTLGENLSDMAGMPLAFAALQEALKRAGAGAAQAKIQGYTPAQRFFLSNALVWRGKARDEQTINLLRTDPHSPGKYRVLAPMSNLPAFAQAFGCKAGDPMVADKPISLWD